MAGYQAGVSCLGPSSRVCRAGPGNQVTTSHPIKVGADQAVVGNVSNVSSVHMMAPCQQIKNPDPFSKHLTSEAENTLSPGFVFQCEVNCSENWRVASVEFKC